MPVLFDATEKVGKLPFVVSVTVTLAPLANAVVPTAALAVLHALIAAARFVARFVVLASVTNVPAVQPVQVAEPLVPAVGPPHEKVASPPATENVVKVPGVVSLAVTVPVLDVALKPAPAGHALMAAATFEASVVVLELVAKVPVVAVVQVFVPALPPVTDPHEKMPALFVFPTARKGPGFV